MLRQPVAFLLAVCASLVALALPSAAPAAGKACPRESARTAYSGAAVHAYFDRRKVRGGRPIRVLIACSHATGRRTEVATDSQQDHEQSSVTVYGLLGGRYLWTSEYFTAAESLDTEVHQLTDVETGRKTTEDEGGDFGAEAVFGVQGALVSTDGTSLFVKRPRSARTTLDAGPVSAPAAAGGTLYWQSGTTVKSAPAPADPPPGGAIVLRPTRKRTPCTPKGRIIVLRRERVVVTRSRGGRLFGCRVGTGRQHKLAVPVAGANPTGPPTDAEVVDGDRMLLYRLPVQTAAGPATAVVLRDVKTGAVVRSAVAAQITEAVTDRTALAYTDGAALTLVDQAGTREIARGAISGLALARDAGFLYWSDGGAPVGVPLE